MNDANWPEEEAGMTFRAYLDSIADDGKEYAAQAMARNVAHMHKVFDDVADAQRYDVELARLIGGAAI